MTAVKYDLIKVQFLKQWFKKK